MSSHFTTDQLNELTTDIIPKYLANKGVALISDAHNTIRHLCGKRDFPSGDHLTLPSGDPDIYDSVTCGDDGAYDANSVLQTINVSQGLKLDQSILVIGDFACHGRMTH